MLSFNKLIRLIIFNIVLLTAIIISLTYDNTPNVYNSNLLDIGDTSLIDKIIIDNHKIVKLGFDNWYIDKINYRLSPSKRRNLLRFLKKLRIKSPLGKQRSDSLFSVGQERGVLVSSFIGQKEVNNFRIIKAKTGALLLKDRKAYSIYIPGYNIDILEYLRFEANDLRDRRVFQTSWKTLKMFKLTSAKASITIQFGKSFYEVVGVSNLDTLKLYNYLKYIEHLEVTKFVTNLLLEDSLKTSSPYFKLFIEDIRRPIPTEIQVYQKDNYYWGLSNNTEDILTFEKHHIQRILQDNKYFEKFN